MQVEVFNYFNFQSMYARSSTIAGHASIILEENCTKQKVQKIYYSHTIMKIAQNDVALNEV